MLHCTLIHGMLYEGCLNDPCTVSAQVFLYCIFEFKPRIVTFRNSSTV